MAVIAIDLGGTKLALALFSDDGEMISSKKVSLEKRMGSEVGRLIIEEANSILQEAKEKNIAVAALGICVPGIAHAKTGRVWAPNISGWDDYPLYDELRNGLRKKDIVITIDSDRACYILGEVWKGNAAGCDDVIFLSVGTGIGAGILINGEVLRGSNDIAGAIGWMALNKPFKKKYISCGCFEYHASGEGIIKVANELLKKKEYAASELHQKSSGGLTAKDIFDAYERNDVLAIAVIEQAIEYWGMAVANLVSLFNPEKIILAVVYLDLL